jgi:hypothetical protein
LLAAILVQGVLLLRRYGIVRLSDGSVLIVDKHPPALRRGDLVVFAIGGEGDGTELSVGRILGAPGDHIDVSPDRQLLIDGGPTGRQVVGYDPGPVGQLGAETFLVLPPPAGTVPGQVGFGRIDRSQIRERILTVLGGIDG